MITIRGWHGVLPPRMIAKLDAFATPIGTSLGYEWTFSGTLIDFVSKWDEKFLAIPEDDGSWFIGVTQYHGFGQR